MVMTVKDLEPQVKDIFLEYAKTNQRFTDQFVMDNNELYKVAHAFLDQYRGDNQFLRSVQHGAAEAGWLSAAQARGILNFMLAGLKRNSARGSFRPEGTASTVFGQPVAQDRHSERPVSTAIVHAVQAAADERVQLRRIEGRPGMFRTRSKSDPTKHYTLAVLPDGMTACSCPGFKNRGDCKHNQALITKLAREHNRKICKQCGGRLKDTSPHCDQHGAIKIQRGAHRD